MRIAVIGAGIVGVTTAFELARDGHQVSVLERRGSVAEEASFAHAGWSAPGTVSPWAAPGMPGQLLRQLFSQHAPLRLVRPMAAGQLGWLWRWWLACGAALQATNRARLHRLAQYSRQHQQALSQQLQLDHEQAQGCLLLLRTPQDLKRARASLKQLAELGQNFHLVDGAAARLIEPGLNPEMALHAAVHLPGDGVGNCRQFAHAMRSEAQRLGAMFKFQRSVLAINAGTQPVVLHRGTGLADAPQSETFDAVVVCAALGAPALLRPLGLKLPLQAVHGCSITAPLRHVEAHPHLGPRSAVSDERYRVSISRLGQRVRVAGGAELGGQPGQFDERCLQTLHKVLDDWYPGCAQQAQLQRWKGARPMLPDGPPVLGISGTPGVWLNLGHGAHGWALACGSARLLADQIGGRAPAIDAEGLDISRLLRPTRA